MRPDTCIGRPQPSRSAGLYAAPPVPHEFVKQWDGSVICKYCGRKPLQ